MPGCQIRQSEIRGGDEGLGLYSHVLTLLILPSRAGEVCRTFVGVALATGIRTLAEMEGVSALKQVVNTSPQRKVGVEGVNSPGRIFWSRVVDNAILTNRMLTQFIDMGKLSSSLLPNRHLPLRV